MKFSRIVGLPALLCLVTGGVMAQSIETVGLRTALFPRNETPAPEGVDASGFGTVWVHLSKNASGVVTAANLEFDIRYKFDKPVAVTGIEIHRGAQGYAGPIVLDSGFRNKDEKADESRTAGASQWLYISDKDALQELSAVMAKPELYYLRIRSASHQGGVLRGQLGKGSPETVATFLSGAELVPAEASQKATAVVAVSVLAAKDSKGVLTSAALDYEIQYSGFEKGTKITGVDLHTGVTRTNGPAAIVSNFSEQEVEESGSGTLHVTVDADTSSTAANAIAGILANAVGYYVNLRTSSRPRGAIRGQLRPTASIQLNSVLSSKNEVPAVTAAGAAGVGQLVLNPLRDNNGDVVAALVTFQLAYSMESAAQVTGFAIHEAPATQNGPARVTSGITEDQGAVATTGNGFLRRRVVVNSKDGLAALNALFRRPDLYYVNLRTKEFPTGVLRAQLGTTSTALPAITDVGGLSKGVFTKVAAPGGRLQVKGRDLARLQASTVSVVGGALPVNLTGTSLTVGGVAAQVVSVAPDSITAIVPSSIVLGRQAVMVLPVIVRTANGASNIGNLDISRSGPVN